MSKLLSIFLILFFLCCSRESVSRNEPRIVVPHTVTSLCKLVNNPEQFVGKPVRVRSALRFGLHLRDLYSVRCNDPKNTTIDLVSSEPSIEVRPCANAGAVVTHPNETQLMGEGTYAIDVEGKLIAAPDPPFTNPFRYKFAAECINERKVIWDRGNGPWALPSDFRNTVELYETYGE